MICFGVIAVAHGWNMWRGEYLDESEIVEEVAVKKGVRWTVEELGLSSN